MRPTKPRGPGSEPPPGMVAAAEQGYHHFLDVLTKVTASTKLTIDELGPLRAFAYLTVRLKLEDPDVRAAFAAIAVIRLAQQDEAVCLADDQRRRGEERPPSTLPGV